MDAALKGRLSALRMAADCCDDLDGVLHAAEAAHGLEATRATYGALADRKRILAAAMIKRSPGLCGCELQAALDLSHATVSHHMRLLVDAGVVEGRRDGKWVRYTLTDAGRALVP